jgi:hypothetical protein
MSIITSLNYLDQILEDTFDLPKSEYNWYGARIAIECPPIPSRKVSDGEFSNWPPEPKYVLTNFDLELSWLFEKLRDAFFEEKRIDYFSRFPFFHRLADTANIYIKNNQEFTDRNLLSVVLGEAYLIYDEMKNGKDNSFGYSVVEPYEP